MQYNIVQSKKFVIPVKTGIQYLISFCWIPSGVYPVLDTGWE
jgi:hypothetical protein